MIDITNPIFHDAEKARKYLESERWPNGPVCPHCGAEGQGTKLKGKSTRPGVYKCKGCEKPYSVTVGTIFERSKIPLNKWLMAVFLFSSSKKGMSAHQLHRMLGITYKTAWFMSHRIREAMTPAPGSTGPLGSGGKIVESDETFVGGKAKNAKKGKPVPKKRAVMALVERGGDLHAEHIPNVTARTVRSVLAKQVDAGAHLTTDDSLVYYYVGRDYAKHTSVNHSADEYVGSDGESHVNTAESFFALIKRQIMGAHHAVSEVHLQRYVSEAAFRWNHRIGRGVDDTERANAILKASGGKRLTYRPVAQ